MAKSKRPTRIKDVGTIYYDSESRQYIGQVENGSYSSGRTKFKRFKGKSKAEVKEKMLSFKSECMSIAAIIPEKDNQIIHEPTLHEYLDIYITTYKKPALKPSSYDRIIVTERNIIEHLGTYPLSAITADIIQRELITAMYESDYSYSTIRKCFILLNECLKSAYHRDLISKNVCECVTVPSKKLFVQKEIRFLNDKEIESLSAAAKESQSINALIIPIMLYTGVRVGEMLSLKWSDIDFKNYYIYVHSNTVSAYDKDHNKRIVIEQDSTKTRKGRIVYLTRSALYYLTRLYQKRMPKLNDYLVITNGKRELWILRRVYNALCCQADIKEPHGLHTLRHTFASLMIRKGIDIKIVSEMLGHSSISFTYNTYVHLIEEEKAKVMQRIDI